MSLSSVPDAFYETLSDDQLVKWIPWLHTHAANLRAEADRIDATITRLQLAKAKTKR